MKLFTLFTILLLLAGSPEQNKSEQEGSARRVDSFKPDVVSVTGLPFERVQMSVSVLDAAGVPVQGLNASDFEILEAGIPQEIIDFGPEFQREDRPLSVVLLFDRSTSIGIQMRKWRYAGLRLLSVLRPIDEIRLSTFTDHVEVEQDFTNDQEAIASVVEQFGEQMRARGGTRIYNSLGETFRDLRDRPGRKVVFLFTDGVVEGESRSSPVGTPVPNGLTHQAIKWQITVITILPGKSSFPWLPVQSLAIHTGGWWLYSGNDLSDLVSGLGERLLGAYYLSYDTDRQAEDSRRRKIEVKLTTPDKSELQVRTISGVYGEVPFVEMLAEDLKADDEDDRIRAVAGLAATDDPEATKPLMRALKDNSPDVRIAALGALAQRGDLQALRKVVRLLKDREPAVRDAALDTLNELYLVAPDEKTRIRILDAIESVE